jgi:hypothetical protein
MLEEVKVEELSECEGLETVAAERIVVSDDPPGLENPSCQSRRCGIENHQIHLVGFQVSGYHSHGLQPPLDRINRIIKIDGYINIA